MTGMGRGRVFADSALSKPCTEKGAAEAERDEWKLEAGRRGWPKDAAQEFFRIRAERDRLRDALEAARQSLSSYDPVAWKGIREALAILAAALRVVDERDADA